MKCKPIFKNGEEEEFGEQKYVTVEMLQRFCRNDAFLKQETERLEYLTPPAIRKRFTPVAVDKSKSYGCMNGVDNNIVFDGGEPSTISVDLTDPNIVDMDLSTTSTISKLEDGVVNTKVITPYEDGNLDSTTAAKGKCNHYYRVSFNPNREYAVRPNWLENQLNNEIPSIGRAQTFKAKKSGILEAVTLHIHGSQDADLHNTASPLIVQIRKTNNKNGVLTPDEVALNYDWEYPVMAQQEVRFLNTQPEECNIVFESPCLVKKDETYAIVVLSPLSHPTHCYWMGCYDKWYNADYSEGNAFWTEDNGMSWNIHETIDFLFTAHIREAPNTYIANKDFYLYLKPILHTGIVSVELNCNDNGKVVYEVSRNGRDWVSLENNQTYGSRDAPLDWDMCFIRAKFKTTDRNTPAYLEKMNLHIFSNSSREMYVRTIPYYPKTNPMLGASVWGRVNAPFEVSDNATCEAEIISMKETEEKFTIINVADLKDLLYFEFIDEAKVKDRTPEQICSYLEDEWSIVEQLKKENIYILPFTKANNETVYFFNKVSLVNSPAYPMISCSLNGENYGEWIDYIFNYGEELLEKTIEGNVVGIEKDNVYFYNDVLENMEPGLLTLKYNPCYFKHLENKDFENGGLTLDYYEDTFESVSEEILENRKVNLKCCPVDPIRKVIVNDDTELVEDVDFKVDYDAPAVEFMVKNDENEICIKQGDKLEIVYTPNIDDTGLSVGYYATRNETNKEVYIKPNYFEFKV